MTSLISTAAGTFRKSIQGLLKPWAAKPLASPAYLHRDFEHDVMERLIRLGANSFGAPVVGLKCTLGGDVVVKCMGFDTKMRWRRYSLRFRVTYLDNFKLLGDPQAIAEMAYAALGASEPPPPEEG